MSNRLTALGFPTLNNRFKALSPATQTKFINNFYLTNNAIFIALDKANKPTFQNWKNWAEGLSGTPLAGAPIATLTFNRYYYRTNDISRVDHAEMGEFSFPSNPQVSFAPGLMESGGHGQKNLDYLAALGWAVNIVKTYPNGVRVGNVPNHSDPTKNGTLLGGVPQNGQSWFPASWTAKEIRDAGNFVFSSNKTAFAAAPNGQIFSGKYFGVKVMILKTVQSTGPKYINDIGSIFPDVNQ